MLRSTKSISHVKWLNTKRERRDRKRSKTTNFFKCPEIFLKNCMGNIDLSFFNAQSVKGLYRSPWETNYYQLWICCVFCLIYTKIKINTHSNNKRINNICLLCEKSFLSSFLLLLSFHTLNHVQTYSTSSSTCCSFFSLKCSSSSCQAVSLFVFVVGS